MRGAAPAQIATLVLQYAKTHGLSAVRRKATSCSRYETIVFAPRRGWTIVFWPSGFATFDVPLAQHLSIRLGTLVSTVHVDDDDSYWLHVLHRRGRTIDQFASGIENVASSDLEAAVLYEAYGGHPDRVADALGVDRELVRPYFVQWNAASEDTVKAFPGDKHPLGSPSVFADFWRRVGIVLPRDSERPARIVGLGTRFAEQLPNAGEL